MKSGKIDVKRAVILGGAFMATCIGSGFATGSEFLSFFVAHGIGGAIGAIAISLIIYFLFTKELFNKGQDLPAEYHNNILAYYFGKIGGEIFDWFSAILVGGCYLIMLNGAGTTLNQYLNWDPLVGAALMALAAIITVWFGLRKVTDIIGSIGPVIAAFSIVIGIVALFRADFSNVDAALETMNLSKAAPNWWLCGIAYPCFAMMTLTPALPSMGATANNRKTTTAAAVFGVILFHLAIAVIVFAIFGNLDIVGAAEVPNLALSGLLGPVAQGIFVVMIILAIYTTACPMMWGFCRKITTDEKSLKYRVCIIALTVLGMIATHFFRLGDLINFIYSMSGYVGAIVLVGMFVSNMIRRKKGSAVKSDAGR